MIKSTIFLLLGSPTGVMQIYYKYFSWQIIFLSNYKCKGYKGCEQQEEKTIIAKYQIHPQDITFYSNLGWNWITLELENKENRR